MQNFFDCVKDRSEPISDVFSHHRTMTSCHMCNIALMVGRDLRWDPKREVFLDNEMANQLMSRPSRQKYLGKTPRAGRKQRRLASVSPSTIWAARALVDRRSTTDRLVGLGNLFRFGGAFPDRIGRLS